VRIHLHLHTHPNKPIIINKVYKYIYIFVASSIFRLRLYFAWFVAEATLLLAGVNRPYDVRNSHFLSIETSRSPSYFIRNWNIRVSEWLIQYVYLRVPFKSKLYQSLCVFLVSAYWHGVHPNYYTFFLFGPIVIACEFQLSEIFGNLFFGENSPKILKILGHVIGWILCFSVFNYAGIGFCIVDWDRTWKVWHSVYYYGHLGTFVALFLALFTNHFILKNQKTNTNQIKSQ